MDFKKKENIEVKESKKVERKAEVKPDTKSIVTEHHFRKGKEFTLDNIPFVVHEAAGAHVTLKRTDIK